LGSEFYTIPETANRLGCCQKSVRNYIKKGFLSIQRSNRVTLVLKEDVDQLAIDQGRDAPAMNRENWFRLNARMEKAEHELFTIKHILEIRSEPLRISPLECKQLYQLSIEYLTKNPWTPEALELWAGYFEKMDDVFLQDLAMANQNQQAWQPFFKLCLAMRRQVEEGLAQKPTIPLQALFMKLDEGRKKLRGTVLMWVSSGQGTVPEAFLATMEDPKETVARHLGAK
jgi:hypothetical protein